MKKQGITKLLNVWILMKVMGILLVILSGFMLTSLIVAFYYHESALPIVYSAIITAITGGVLAFIGNRHNNKNIGKREGYTIVTLTWVIISVFGSLPFMFSGAIPGFTNAFFETMSGFTTTGSSVLTDIESVAKNILYWRAMTHWIGGMGIIVLTVAVLPFLGIGGMQLLIAEMPGIAPDKLHPRITATAKRFWGIYLILTLVEILLLWAGEMNLFDSVCHAFATMATGGFSTKNDSIAGFMPYSQYVIIVFMILAGTNFTLHYFTLHGQFKKVIKNEEFRTYLVIILVITLALTFGLITIRHSGIESAFRDSLFTVVSILTTTGFVTADYILWPVFLWILIAALMFIGGSAGSTGGGVKIIRHLLLLKNSWIELKRTIHPAAIIPVKYGGKSIGQQVIFNVMAFFLIYILIFSFGVIIMALLGLDFETSVGASIASLGNIGPGIGGVGPVENYAFIPPLGKWILSFLMLLGRLELFTVLIIFSPAFWKK
jgi:trk system potassium uptake protein TrkH